ncbi:alcohol dehydrogenase catalytic domain-containing protein [Cnuibacter physcomitrellae]|uniref:zinc-dependent alcohol dehydrogenase n=1 Tax=Cnuibacter physcomitrellae TaxID=1619308 RepID=UPI0021761481|nr:alcohol dehydrogenase catalytic domain-containing protein [Cnuibacter physcomitrellae]MCS5498344.1 alcohol dehydrogenase catalytic domain-containing protein [Cnuibacter physcomitrellae]
MAADAAAPFGTSRQVVFPRPHEIVLDTSPVPRPGPGEMLLRIKRVGICATDLHLLEGHIGDPFPLVPGHEFVGEIAAVGPDTDREEGFAEGDHVAVEMLVPCRSCARCREGRYNLCERDDPASGLGRGQEYGINIPRTEAPGLWGGYADYLIVPREAIVHRVPDSIDWTVAALIEPFAVAWRAIARGGIRPGDSVAVVGPGPVGLLTAAAASLAGAAAVAVVGTRASRLETARRFGADVTVDARTSEDLIGEVTASLGRRPDVVVETAGSPSAQALAVRLVRRGGRVVLAGACGRDVTLAVSADEDLLTREIDVLPSFLSAGGYEPAIAALARAAFPYRELVTHAFPLEAVEEAFHVVRTKADDVLKAVLDLDRRP